MPRRDMTQLNSLVYQRFTVPSVERKVYLDVIEILTDRHIPFLVGGGMALAFYTGLERATKDLDLIVLPRNASRAMEIAAAAGYQTKLRFEHWLGKLSKDDVVVDIIFGSGNGLCVVDEEWFDHAISGTMFNRAVEFCAPEEIIWSKAFVMERNRFDGADIAHLIAAKGEELDWARLLRRFHTHWRVLFSHLILCSYIFPSNRSMIPDWVIAQLLRQT
ncbi:MAG TPA: nucleotidyl transferase AbiEii/AbiGii toxin family protein, partial [Nitrospiraceae bacterium]|nr:nucleotidyl transferase AbiEii/AbiGii toxin family protein [Nitrospiraceae bacterium]